MPMIWRIPMIDYTVCYIKQGSKILLLNREYPACIGHWNGIGGKLEEGESPRESILREMKEETGLKNLNVQFKGVEAWIKDD